MTSGNQESGTGWAILCIALTTWAIMAVLMAMDVAAWIDEL